MHKPRVYIDKPLAINETVVLPKEAAHHLLRVLRCRVGDKLTLFNGDGGCYPGVLMSVAERSAAVNITGFIEQGPSQVLEITLALGICRGVQMDFAVQKAVEAGASNIIPLLTRRSHVKLKEERLQPRLQHWRKIILHACEQCGRDDIPTLASPETSQDWLGSDLGGMKLLLSTGADKTLSDVGEMEDGRITLLIGPESGLDVTEHALAINQGFRAVKLGPRTLRAETAVMASIVAVQTLWGDFR